ncbi:Hypothetical predicted protein [Mytilus galloprovincialis]|uniref:C-type lectin domain-containing protein n=1 Tax=Mytilus galloprovincialis TaxID=29158 RepID=A0A8B6F5Z4_MYTGA|nr:Hypothetical predicted protein [Mytilus galloprovincialis]
MGQHNYSVRPFRILLYKISKDLASDDVTLLASFSPRVFKLTQQEKATIKSALDLFVLLEKRGIKEIDHTNLLKEMVKSLENRGDLVDLVDKYQGPPVPFYEMTSKPRGICVIINNKNFIKMKAREGTDVDQGWQNWKHGWQRYEDSCYIIQYTLQTWDEAKNLCHDNLNAYLAEIKTSRENSFLMGILPKPNIDITGLAGEVWLGANALNVKRLFIWNNSSTYLDFTDWGPGEPNGRDYEHCLSTHMYNDGKLHWNDRACSTWHFFVCEKSVGLSGCGE